MGDDFDLDGRPDSDPSNYDSWVDCLAEDDYEERLISIGDQMAEKLGSDDPLARLWAVVRNERYE